MHFLGKIRDPLHNTIPYTAEEKVIIDRPEFQRLRRIHQTAFIQYVFPGATHTRFEHSLGAMHIAGLLYSALVSNQRRIAASMEQVSETRPGLEYLEKSNYLAQCLRFSALLHDCGHSPLSHSGERFMPTWSVLESNLAKLNLPTWLHSCLKKKISDKKDLNERIHHEIYTLLIVQHMFKYNEELLSEKMGRDICAVLDTSITPHSEGDLAKSGMQSLFHEVISGEIDVDRMDYLLRDSRECGVVYGHFDLGRILDSVCFYFDEPTKQYHLAIRRSGIPAYEDYLRARHSMYNQVYFHKTATACEAMLEYLKKKIPTFYFPLSVEEYVTLDDYNILSCFKQNNIFQFARELLFERKLWKRVYEETIPFQATQTAISLCPAVIDFLAEQNIPAELIETSTSLTRFSPKPKGRKGIEKNNFKVIIKNVNSERFLEPIENHSNLVNRADEEFLIRRIFIARYNENGEEIDANAIKKLIAERVLK